MMMFVPPKFVQCHIRGRHLAPIGRLRLCNKSTERYPGFHPRRKIRRVHARWGWGFSRNRQTSEVEWLKER